MSRQSTLSQTRSALLAPMVRLALTTFLALTAWIVLTSLASSSAPAQARGRSQAAMASRGLLIPLRCVTLARTPAR